MSSAGKHARRPRRCQAAELLPGGLRSLTRLGVTAAVAALMAVATMVAAVLTASLSHARPGGAAAGTSVQAPAPLSAARHAASSAASAAHAQPAAPGGQALAPLAPLTLTAADRRDCPAAAMACVDLARHLTWLQSGGRVTFGPVQIEPGKPGSAHQTPRGTFRVEWKAGLGLRQRHLPRGDAVGDVLRGRRHRVPRRRPHPVVARLRAPHHGQCPLLQRSPARRRGGCRLLTQAALVPG